MTMTADEKKQVDAVRDLFLLNPEIQKQLRVFSDPKQFIDELVKVAHSHNLSLVNVTILREAIKIFAESADGEASACLTMDKKSHMHGLGLIPDFSPNNVENIILETINFLNSGDSDKGPGICNW